jgi:cytochrome P450
MALQKEIDAAHESGRLSSPMVADSEARALPYLQAVLREAIRTHPAAVAPSKLSPVDTDQVCGYSIPGGTQIGANMPGLLRSETIFGHDADCFRPERWLEAALESDGQRLDRMKISLDLVFGAGKYYCLGSAIAHMEVRKLFVEVGQPNFLFAS